MHAATCSGGLECQLPMHDTYAFQIIWMLTNRAPLAAEGLFSSSPPVIRRQPLRISLIIGRWMIRMFRLIRGQTVRARWGLAVFRVRPALPFAWRTRKKCASHTIKITIVNCVRRRRIAPQVSCENDSCSPLLLAQRNRALSTHGAISMALSSHRRHRRWGRQNRRFRKRNDRRFYTIPDSLVR